MLSPVFQTHLWGIHNLPVILSGLCALPIRPTHIKPLTIFHNKILRGFLKISSSTPIPSLHFLLGELPLEAHVHMSTQRIFYNIWCNVNTALSMTCSSISLECVKIPLSHGATTFNNFSASTMTPQALLNFLKVKDCGPVLSVGTFLVILLPAGRSA